MIRYVFCAATGRCGTNYLADLLGAHPQIVARHEPAPNMQGEMMRAWNEGRPEAMRAAMPEKFAAIEAARGDKIYVETSNAFLKGFGWELLRGGYIKPEETLLVHLERNGNLPEWIESLRAYNFGTDMHWSILPTDHEAAWFGDHPDICVWYIEEIFARRSKMRGEFPEINLAFFDLDELNTQIGVEVLLHLLGLRMTLGVKARIGVRVNVRSRA